MILEVHIIQSIPTNRINSDRDGKPKSIVFGGVSRTRISSQAQKRAARMYTHEHELLPQNEFAERTRKFTELVMADLVKHDIAESEAKNLAIRAMSALGMSHQKKDVNKSNVNEKMLNEYMILFSQHELDTFVEAILTHKNTIGQLEFPEPEKIGSETNGETQRPATKKPKNEQKKDAAKIFPKEVQIALKAPFIFKRAIELGLYGRELADFPDGVVDGQVQVAHAMSVHETLREDDFFVSIDDHANENEANAGMLGEVGITAPTLYRTAAVNVSQLAREIGDMEAAKLGARAFLEAFTLALPKGGQNSYLAYTTPQFVLFRQVLKGTALTLAPAFEMPVQPQYKRSLADVAIERLDQYINRTEQVYPQIKRAKNYCVNLGNYEFQSAKQSKTLQDAINQLLKDFDTK